MSNGPVLNNVQLIFWETQVCYVVCLQHIESYAAQAGAMQRYSKNIVASCQLRVISASYSQSVLCV